MNATLIRIKRAVIAGRIIFTSKAELEMERDILSRSEVVESIIYADDIYKTLRSTSAHREGREYLHIIIGSTLSGEPIYTKGKLVEQHGVDTYYVLVSAKQAI